MMSDTLSGCCGGYGGSSGGSGCSGCGGSSSGSGCGGGVEWPHWLLVNKIIPKDKTKNMSVISK